MSEIDVEAVDEVDRGDDPDEATDRDDETGSADDRDADDTNLEVAVEATELPSGVDAPEYVLYGGKGGVGKTTMAAATALSSAAGGQSTLVVSTDPAHSLSDTLSVAIPPTPTRIHEELPLWAAEIDPDAAMEEGVFGADGDPLGGLGDIGDGLGGDMFGQAGEDLFGGEGVDADDVAGGLDPMLGGSMPGADEAAAMRQLLEYLDDPRFDRVVVDTAPTGHTLRLLQLPELMDSMVGKLLSFRQRLQGMMENLKGVFGDGPDAGDPMADLEALRDRIERLRTVLQDPEKTDFRVVMVPEEMSVVESERLVSQVSEFGIPVQTLVVNRVMEDLADVAGEIDAEWVVSPDLESCAFCQRRWEVQQHALRRATDLYRGRTVKRVPLLADEVKGEAALRVVAACLD